MQSAKSFSLEVEKLALEKKITHMEAVLEYCKEHQLEPDSVGRLISKSLKDCFSGTAIGADPTGDIRLEEVMDIIYSLSFFIYFI